MIFRAFVVIAVLLGLYAGYEAFKVWGPDIGPSMDAGAYGYGPEDAGLTVVEYLDYACPYCRDVHPDILKAVEEDGDVRYIPRPLPPVNVNSATASRATYAAALLGKFREAHDYQIAHYRDGIDVTYFEEMAEAIGVNSGDLIDAYNEKRTLRAITDNGQAFNKIEGQYTPTFVIGDTVFVPKDEMPDSASFLELFQQEREKNQ